MLSEKPWKLERTILVVIIAFGFFLFFSGLEGLALKHSGQKKIDENSLLQVLLMVLTIHGSILAATAMVLRHFDVRWRDAFGFAAPGKIPAIFLGLSAAAIFLPIGIILRVLSLFLIQLLKLPSDEQQAAVVTLQNADSPACRAVLVIFAVILAPVAEEILFRGVIYPTIKQLGFKHIAIWGTSILFAAFHLSPPVFLPLLVLALFLTWLYEYTDNLLAPIVAHGIFNGINVVFLYYGEAIQDFLSRQLLHQQ